MSFPRYPAYKDSGVAWLGEVPAHWEVAPLKASIERIESGVSVNATDTPAEGDQLGVLKTSCVYTGQFDAAENKAVFVQEYDRVACPVVKNTLIVSRMNTPDLVGAAGLTKSDHSTLFLPDRLWQVFPKGVRADFLHYWTRTGSYRAQVEMACAGTSSSMQNLGQDDFRSFIFARPATEEQAAIVAFLNHETAKIDALVAEQERLIELLKEKRQAVISHAVTKGLDPSVPMKDSGVEWLGKVPAHWSAVRLKFVASDIKAGPFGSALTKDMYASSGYRVYGQEQVIPSDFSLGDYYIDEGTFAQLAQYATQEGDVLISCVGTFGKIAVVPENAEPGIINPRLIRLRVIDDVSPNYLAEVLRSTVTFEQFSVLSRGGTMDVINIGTLSEIWVAVPPYAEQHSILEELLKLMGEFDALVAEAVLSIELLRERRTALISAAVTGQIDVCGWVPAETAG